MTTPAPKPPDGYRLLTDEETTIPIDALVFDRINGWIRSLRCGKARSEGAFYATAMTNPPNDPTPERPAAYAIYGIDTSGHHYIDEIRVPMDDEWGTDDNGLGDRWAGNEPLCLERRAIAAEKERDELREDIEWLHRNRLSASPEAIRAARLSPNQQNT